MVVGEVAELVDFLVVGGGPGGYVAALEAAALGREVVLVDRQGEAGLGGACLHVGCIPSKALIEVAETLTRARHFEVAGLRVGSTSVDMVQFQQWKTGFINALSGGIGSRLKAAGVRVISGTFRFTAPGRGLVLTSDQRPPDFFEFKDAVIATGSTPVELPGMPRDGTRILDSSDVLAMTRLPKSIAIVGAGYIGIELGTALRKLGCAVSLVEAEKSILPGLDSELVAPVRRRLAELGVDIRLETRVVGYEGDLVEVRGADNATLHLEAESMAVAVGRRPNTGDLGLAAIGVSPRPDGLLEVAKDRRIKPNVAAIGDITPGPALAHKASAEAVVAAASLCGRRAAFDPTTIPLVVFSDPEIAIAGPLDGDSQEIVSARQTFRASGRANTMGNPGGGFVRMMVDRATNAIVGVQIVGPHASELISEAVLAIEMGATPMDISGSIHPHPTLSESLADVALHQELRAAAVDA